jgi:hypothetical protein
VKHQTALDVSQAWDSFDSSLRLVTPALVDSQRKSNYYSPRPFPDITSAPDPSIYFLLQAGNLYAIGAGHAGVLIGPIYLDGDTKHPKYIYITNNGPGLDAVLPKNWLENFETLSFPGHWEYKLYNSPQAFAKSPEGKQYAIWGQFPTTTKGANAALAVLEKQYERERWALIYDCADVPISALVAAGILPSFADKLDAVATFNAIALKLSGIKDAKWFLNEDGSLKENDNPIANDIQLSFKEALLSALHGFLPPPNSRKEHWH